MGLRIKLCIVFRDTVTCEGSSHLYLFYCQSRHEIQNGSPTKNVNPTSVKLFCDRVSYFHIICLSCIKAGGIQCSSGWCDPQIDLFISNDKRWAWTGLLIYSDWNATVIDGEEDLLPTLLPHLSHDCQFCSHLIYFTWPSSRLALL